MSYFPGPLVIVGAGLAGYALAREFRKRAPDQEVVVVCADSGCQYSKPALSTAMAHAQKADDLVMAMAADMADRLKIVVRNNTRVDAIDAAAHALCIGNERFQYGKLVLATGSDPRLPALEGNATSQMLSVNNLQDYRRLRQQLDHHVNPRPRLVIAGGGLVGCELANDFAQAGVDVDLVVAGEQLLSGALPAPIAQRLQERLEHAGVACHLNRQVQGLHRHPQGLLVGLDNRQHLPAQCLVAATGLEPETRLARSADLTLGQRGITVDRYLQTSDPDIYALGDCAEVDGHSLMYVKPLMACAKALAQTLSGEPVMVRYEAMPVTLKTPAMPLRMALPARSAPDQWRIAENSQGFRAEYRNTEGRLLGYALTDGRVAEQSELDSQLPDFF